MPSILFLKSALDDLDEIVAYIASDNKKAALDFHDTLIGKVQKLAQFPKMGQLIPESKMQAQGYRFIVCDDYLVFYREIDDHIYIYRVLHGRRDYAALFRFNEK